MLILIGSRINIATSSSRARMFLTAKSPQSVRNVKNAKIQNMETSFDLPSYENSNFKSRLLILIGILNRFYSNSGVLINSLYIHYI